MRAITTCVPLKKELSALKRRFDSARIGLIGDFCLDAYWDADMRRSELSRETPHYPLPVVSERYSPGGAGNVAANIAALQPGTFLPVGLIGDDWRGMLLRHELTARGIVGEGLIAAEGLITNAYIKPIRHGISEVAYEDPRLDFNNVTPPDDATEAALIRALDDMAEQVDVICVCDQLNCGCITDAVHRRVAELARSGKRIIVDSRDSILQFGGAVLKPNIIEAAAALNKPVPEGLAEQGDMAQELLERSGSDMIVMTMGDHGCMTAQKGEIVWVPPCPVKPPVDFCGAGDSFLCGLAMGLAIGAPLVQAAQLGTLCAAVTIKKVGETGTATRTELTEARNMYGG